MAKFVYLYSGGAMAETPEAQASVMQAWNEWFGVLGETIVDGGAPFGESATIATDGAISAGSGGSISGYSVVQANTLDEATAAAKGCPVLADGGSVQVYQALEM